MQTTAISEKSSNRRVGLLEREVFRAVRGQTQARCPNHGMDVFRTAWLLTNRTIVEEVRCVIGMVLEI